MKSILYFLLCLPICLQAQNFEEQALELGVNFVSSGSGFMSGGVAISDINNDGWDDLYINGKNQMDALFINDGTGSSFTNVAESLGFAITDDYRSDCVAIGDLNNDDLKDILIGTTDSNDGRPLLFFQQADGTFVESGQSAGLNIFTRTFSCSLFDANLDGWLDIYLGNYVEDPAFVQDDEGNFIGFDHTCFPDHFFLNNGDGTFSDATASYGFDNNGCTLAVTPTDFDRDQKPDLMAANDFGDWVIPSKLYRNQHPAPSFEEVSGPLGANLAMYAMGIATADVNGDLRPDYYISNMGRNALLVGEENGFQDLATNYGVENEATTDGLLHTSWGTFFFDADNDTWPDLYVANGHMPTIDVLDNVVKDKNKFYRNLAGQSFEDLSEASGLADSLMGRGAACGDLDRDGDIDIVLIDILSNLPSTADRVKIFLNEGNENHYIQFDLVGTLSHSEAFNTQVVVWAGGRAMWQEKQNATSYCSQNSAKLHFGLGENTAIDSAQFFWPSGVVSSVGNLSSDTLYTIEEPFDIGVSYSLESESRFYYADGQFYIDDSWAKAGSTWSVIDVQGKVLFNESIGSSILVLPSKLEKGMYFARLEGENTTQTIRFFP